MTGIFGLEWQPGRHSWIFSPYVNTFHQFLLVYCPRVRLFSLRYSLINLSNFHMKNRNNIDMDGIYGYGNLETKQIIIIKVYLFFSDERLAYFMSVSK